MRLSRKRFDSTHVRQKVSPRQSQSLEDRPAACSLGIRLHTSILLLFLCLLGTSSVLAEIDSRPKDEDSTPDSSLPSDEKEAPRTLQGNIKSMDLEEDSLFDPLQADPDCETGSDECFAPPDTTVEEEVVVDDTCSSGGEDTDAALGDPKTCPQGVKRTDKHWGSDPNVLRMRDLLRVSGSGISSKKNKTNRQQTDKKDNAKSSTGRKGTENQRPPVFLMPGLASTRLVAWRFKGCPHNPLLSDIRVQDYVWLNINLIFQMSTIDERCYIECMQLGWNQTDTDDASTGCKLRPDEGLDAISSLSPGGIGSDILVGSPNTVYAWFIQWLADNLGYDVSNIVGLPYDWRLSPDKMESRDGFLTLTRRRIEAAVQANGKPGIMVAHSMGNLIFRYFLQWMRAQLRQEAYQRYIKQAKRRAKAKMDRGSTANAGWIQGIATSFDEWWYANGDSLDELAEEKNSQLWELAQIEGDDQWYEWVEKHIWTYVGLSAPLLGAVNPLRAVISGENMGVPVTDESARILELSFGSTHTCSPLSSKSGFCDQWDQDDWDAEPDEAIKKKHADSRLACLDDILTEIELSADQNPERDPWGDFPALKNLMRTRSDWDSDFPMIRVVKETCEDGERSPCAKNETLVIGPKDVETGKVFRDFQSVWKEKDSPLHVKLEQLKESFWDTDVKNVLNKTWERPLIKHVVMAYGVDIPTEVGYVYRKKNTAESNKKTEDESISGSYDGIPNLESALWETAGGRIVEERFDTAPRSIGDILLMKKKPRRKPHMDGHHAHSGDGSVPYLSLSWAHTWLLHAVRAERYSQHKEGSSNPLDDINVSHRPKGGREWIDGFPKRTTIVEDAADQDTGTSHPHGTKYKPDMLRYYSNGTSRTTGIEYTTTVIEAIGVEHKETTRNYDILAAAFTDVLRFMHDDLDML